MENKPMKFNRLTMRTTINISTKFFMYISEIDTTNTIHAPNISSILKLKQNWWVMTSVNIEKKIKYDAGLKTVVSFIYSSFGCMSWRESPNYGLTEDHQYIKMWNEKNSANFWFFCFKRVSKTLPHRNIETDLRTTSHSNFYDSVKCYCKFLWLSRILSPAFITVQNIATNFHNSLECNYQLLQQCWTLTKGSTYHVKVQRYYVKDLFIMLKSQHNFVEILIYYDKSFTYYVEGLTYYLKVLSYYVKELRCYVEGLTYLCRNFEIISRAFDIIYFK